MYVQNLNTELARPSSWY